MKKNNGHYPLQPANQFCAFCGIPMFVKACADRLCKHPKPVHFTNEDWGAEMQLAKELAEEN